MKTLGIDIGGSALKGAPVDTKTGRLLAERRRIETHKGETPAEMARAVREIARHFQWQGPIGVGFPGVVQGSKILTAANLHRGFVNCDAGKIFSRASGCRVAVTNDASAAASAEMRFGAGRGFHGKALLLTLGTGVGTALAYQGVVTPLELGHLPWPHQKSAEKYVAASAREKEDLGWQEWGRRLRDYVELLESVLWPELIIIGGGVSAKHRKFFRYIKPRARLVPAEFLNQAGIVGAALWAAEAK